MHIHAAKDISFQIVFSILFKVDAIRFAYEYSLMNNNEKRTWLRERYVQEHPLEFTDMSPEEINVKLAKDQTGLAKWKKTKGETTTTRSRLLNLYLHVSDGHASGIGHSFLHSMDPWFCWIRSGIFKR